MSKMLKKIGKAWLDTWFEYSCHMQMMAPYQITYNKHMLIKETITNKKEAQE